MGFTITGASQVTGSGLDFVRNGLVVVSEAATVGKMDVLIVVKASRLGRDTMKAMDFIRQMNEHGVKLYSPLEGEISPALHNEFISHFAGMSQI